MYRRRGSALTVTFLVCVGFGWLPPWFQEVEAVMQFAQGRIDRHV